MTHPVLASMALTARVRKDGYYTDGHDLFEIVRVYPVGHIQTRNLETDEVEGWGITRFRQIFWMCGEKD